MIKEALQGGIQTERQVFSFVVTRSWYEQLGIFLLGALAIAWLSVFYIQKRTMKRASLAYTFGTPVVDIHQSQDLVSVPLDLEKEAREEFVAAEGRLVPEEREASSVEP
ncbi:hypothetical protein [Enterovibrio coralii]|uniref:Uncharacterized protein n=1 Tax=Enterovibrio coralii TaxID=294935 RepID=A0A135I7L8_9GAMM|nr:hypothetical protein [Enterovibrio coralii]KXF81445.1 hypothetical protein ATN88_01585 [Enterovibrio coralii]